MVGGPEALMLDGTQAFVRGFMLFSLLANLAEDRQGVAADPCATLADALAKLKSRNDPKTDITIASRYSELVEDKRCAMAIFGRIRDAWVRTSERLLEVRGEKRLLENDPALDSSIRLRLPYIEPLNLLQVELLKRHRAGETDPRIHEGIHLSINAIATVLRNSG